MAAASTVAAQMVPLGELFNQAGAGDGIKQYLAAKKISTTPTLALIARNAEEFTTMIISPFLAGVTIDGQDHKAEGGQEPVAGAIIDPPVRRSTPAMGHLLPSADSTSEPNADDSDGYTDTGTARRRHHDASPHP